MTLTDAAPDMADLSDGDALFRRYYPFILFLGRRRLEYAAPADRAFGADDLAQEIAAAVYRGRHYFRPDRGRLTAWLARMASRTAGMVRKSTTAAKRFRFGAGREPLSDRPAPAADELRDAGAFWQLVAGLLGPLELEVLALRFAAGADLKEIGDHLFAHCAGRSREARASRVLDGALQKLHRRRSDLRRALGLG